MPRILVVLTLVACAACGSDSRDDERSVVAAFYALGEVARVVGGERVEVSDLTPAGQEPHDLDITTRQVDRIEDADLVLYLGSGFQPALERVAKRTSGRALDLLPTDENDPHVWLNPRLLQDLVTRVERALADLDPEGAAGYGQRAAAYRDRLVALDREYATALAMCDRRVIVTAHDAFGHLARRYDLEVEGIAGIDPQSEPDADRLAELTDLVRRRGITTVFTEELVSPRVAEALAREAGVRTEVLDPVESLSKGDVEAGKDYVAVMRENLATLVTALGCRS